MPAHHLPANLFAQQEGIVWLHAQEEAAENTALELHHDYQLWPTRVWWAIYPLWRWEETESVRAVHKELARGDDIWEDLLAYHELQGDLQTNAGFCLDHLVASLCQLTQIDQRQDQWANDSKVVQWGDMVPVPVVWWLLEQILREKETADSDWGEWKTFPEQDHHGLEKAD